MISRRVFQSGCMVLCITMLFFATPTFAWYYFTAFNGQRMQWVFGSSCNASGSRPIKMIYDSDIANLSAGYQTAIANVMGEWNTAAGTNLVCSTATCNPANNAYQRNMTAGSVLAFMQTPSPNEVWVVWDADGTVLSTLGLDPNPSAGLFGFGIGFRPNLFRPQDVCSGMLVLNSQMLNGQSASVFQTVVLHELGHVLGFAHSVSGLSQSGVVQVPTASNLPVMYPFYITGAPTQLNEDDKAGARTLYAP